MLPLDADGNLAYTKTAAPRTRGSVRRASGFVQIGLALNNLQKKRREGTSLS